MFAASSHKSKLVAWKAIYCEHKHVLYICYMQLAACLKELLCYSRKFWNVVCTSLWNKMFCQESAADTVSALQGKGLQSVGNFSLQLQIAGFFFFFKFEKCFAYNPKRTYLDACCLFTSYPVQDTMFSLAQPNYCFLLHDHSSWSSHLPTPLSLEALGLNLKASHRSTNTGMGRVCFKRIVPVRKMTGWFGTLQVSKPSNVKSILSFADAVIMGFSSDSC